MNYYYIINKHTLNTEKVTSAYAAACYMLGRRVENYFIVKNEKSVITDLPSDVTELEKVLEFVEEQ